MQLREASGRWLLVAPKLTWSNESECISFHLTSIPMRWPTVADSPSLYRDVWGFLAHIRVRHTEGTVPGVSWIELAALFVATGGSLDLRSADATQASSRTTLPQAVHAFKSAVRLIVRASASPILRKYLGPSTSSMRRLEPLGYDSQTPSVACVRMSPRMWPKASRAFSLTSGAT